MADRSTQEPPHINNSISTREESSPFVFGFLDSANSMSYSNYYGFNSSTPIDNFTEIDIHERNARSKLGNS